MKWLRFGDWSLLKKFLAVLLLASTLPLVKATGYGIYRLREQRLESLRHELDANAHKVAGQLDQFHGKYFWLVRSVAQKSIINQRVAEPGVEGEKHREKIESAVFPKLQEDPDIRGISLLDPKGNILASSGDLKNETNLLRYGYVKETLAKGDARVFFYCTESNAERKPEEKNKNESYEILKPTIAYVHAVKPDEENVGGIVVVWVKAEAFWKILKEKQVGDVGRGSYLTLYDNMGVRIGHSSNQTVLFFPGGDLDQKTRAAMIEEARFGKHTADFLLTEEEAKAKGRKVKHFKDQFDNAVSQQEPEAKIFEGLAKANDKVNVGIPYRLKRSGWTFFYMIPKEDLNASAISFSTEIVITSVIVIFLVLFAGILFVRHILRPISPLARAMENLGAGKLDSRAKIANADEIGRLGLGFNTMADQLQKAMESLTHAQTAQAASEGQLRAIMNAVEDGILTINKKREILSFNHGAARIFDHKPEEMIGKKLSLLLAKPEDELDTDNPNSSDSVQRTRDDGLLSIVKEVEGRRKDGSLIPLEMTQGKALIGDKYVITVTFHDLRERKKIEVALRRAMLEAEQNRKAADQDRNLAEHARDEAVSARKDAQKNADAAEKARQEAQENAKAAKKATEAKSQFLATMSHELRTPLTAILGYTEIMQESVAENEPIEMSDLEKVHSQARHLLTVINEVLDVAKLESGKVDLYLEEFDLAKFLPDVADTASPLMAKNSNRLEINLGADLGKMRTDRTRLKQCLINLLSNSAKFTRDGVIAFNVARENIEGKDWIRFQVRDTGIGMTEEQLAKIFKPFIQADASTTREFGGTGLGLTIVRNLCQLMGGDVSVGSVHGKGSTFTILVPAKAPKPAPKTAAPPAAAPSAALPPPGGNTVLVVDDDPAVLDILSRFLTKEGFQVVTTLHGEECLALAKKVRPRAITLDVMMPDKDGWSILADLKRDPELANIPVIILSIVEDKNMGFALGAADYLVKPLDCDRLLDVLKHRGSAAAPLALIAEDDPATREILRRHLEKDGWTVAEATNGKEALEFVASQMPALILLDLMMPEMDGFEFISELSEHPEWRGIPVIVITAKDLTEEDRMFLNGSMLLSGCVKRVLQKGKFSREELLQDVHELLGKS